MNNSVALNAVEIFNSENKFKIDKEKLRFVCNEADRKECFSLLNLTYFPLEPNVRHEVIFSKPNDDYFILLYGDRFTSDEDVKNAVLEDAERAAYVILNANIKTQSCNSLLKILSDFVNGRESEEITVTDEMIKLSREHGIECIIFNQTKDSRTKNAYFSAVKRHMRNNSALNKIKSEFEKADIQYYLVKGARIQSHYPVPALRTMGDCDIHIHPEDKLRAAEIMKNLGYWEEIQASIEEWRYHKGDLVFELHDKLVYDDNPAFPEEKEFLSGEWNYVENNVVDEEFNFIYLLSHLKKHLVSRGVGFRQFMDIAVETKYGNLDFDKIKTFADKAGLLNFLCVCNALCERWFDVETPFKAEITEIFYREATYKIMNNGAFGFQSKKDKYNNFVDSVENDGKIKTLLTSLFLPYHELIKSSEFSWLEGKKFLLPIAWIYRIFIKILNPERRKQGKYIFKKIVGADIKNNDSHYSEWGL